MSKHLRGFKEKIYLYLRASFFFFFSSSEKKEEEKVRYFSSGHIKEHKTYILFNLFLKYFRKEIS